MTIRYTLFLLILPVVALAAASEPTAQERVEKLIVQLGSKQFAEREAASRSLETLGEPALEVLRKARTSEDAEISRRAEELFARIERRVENTRLLAARRIRLTYKDAKVLDVLADVTRKTGFPIDFEGDRSALGQRTLTLDTGEVTVWEALDQFLRAAGLAERVRPAPVSRNTSTTFEIQNGVIIQGRVNIVSSYVEGRPPAETRLVVVNGQQPQWPAHDAGAVRVRAVPAPVAGNSSPLGAGEVRVHLEVLSQPLLPWQGVHDVRVFHAVDEHGQTMTQPLPPTLAASPLNEVWARNGAVFVLDSGLMEMVSTNRYHSVSLKGGPKAAKTIRELRGVVTAQTEVGPEPLVTVDNVFQAVGRSYHAANGSAVKVLGATREADGKIKVRVELQNQSLMAAGGGVIIRGGRRPWAGNAMEVETAALPLALLDAAGQRVQLSSIESPQQQVVNPFGFPQELTLTYEPKAGQETAAKLVYIGKRTVVLDIPFTLKDVPVP